MKDTLTIDRAGRIVLPKPVRKQFHLHGGSTMSLTVRADAIVLRPSMHTCPLAEEGGVLVHEGEPTGDLLAAVDEVRERRDRDVAGERP